MQMACYFATVFNGGTRYSAHLLGGVREFFTGKELYSTEAEVLDTVQFSDSTYNTLLSGIRDVVRENGILVERPVRRRCRAVRVTTRFSRRTVNTMARSSFRYV